jgi:hypothetical protein
LKTTDRSRRRSVLLGFFALFVLFCTSLLLLWLALPLLLGGWATQRLKQEGVEGEVLRFAPVGMQGTSLQAGALSWRGQELSWDAITIEYSPGTLMGGSIRRITLNQPEIGLGPLVGIDRPSGEPLPPSGQPVEGEIDPVVPVPESIPPTALDTPPPVAGLEKGAGQPSLTLAGMLKQHLELEVSPLQVLTGLPFAELVVESGRLSGFGVVPDGTWSAAFQRRSGSVEGLFQGRADGIELEASIRGMRGSGRLAGQASAFFNRPQLQLILDTVELPLPAGCTIEADGAAEALAFSESLDEVVDQVSGEIKVGGIRAHWPEADLQLNLKQLVFAGSWVDETLRFHGGGRVGTELGGFRLFPMGVRIFHDGGEGLQFESEVADWLLEEWQGSLAIMGQLSDPLLGADEGRHLRAEVAFTRSESPYFGIEPFSLLAMSDFEAFSVESSEIGLVKASTLWIENLSFDSGSGRGGFDWYSGVGLPMGRLDLSMGSTAWIFQLLPEDEAGGRGELRLPGEGTPSSLSYEGSLPGTWLNALLDWWGMDELSWGGASPLLNLQLSLPENALPEGQARLSMMGSSLSLPSEVSLENLRGICRLRIKGWPSTEGAPLMRADRLGNDDWALQDLRLSWALPTARQLEIREFTAKVGPTGRMEVVPFTLDPLSGEWNCRILFHDLTTADVFSLLGEERFKFAGLLDGFMEIEVAGTAIVLRNVEFTLKESTSGRFLFQDAAFLREQFEGFTGVPQSVRDDLLDALLNGGIVVGHLKIELLPVDAEGFIELRLELGGETRSEKLEIPIEGLVIRNRILESDLRTLIGLGDRLFFGVNPD